jgi:hypothetical protein
MKPRHGTRRRDPFADEPTAPYDPGTVPVAVDDEDTRPVDVEEMEGAARRSCDVRDPSAPVTARHAQPRPYVELAVAGAGAIVMLPVHRISATGVVLVVPPGVDVDLAADADVMAIVHLVRGDAEPVRARLPAQVAHHRAPRNGVSGGLSLRWDVTEPGNRLALEALLARAGG